MKGKVKSEKRKVENGKRKVLRSPFSVFSLILLLALVASCNCKKKLVAPTPQANYEWMTAKLSISLEESPLNSHLSPLTSQLPASLRMHRDSTLWLSVSGPMGMEAVRARVTTDSVLVVNRFDRTYLAEPLAEVASKLHLPSTVQEIQAMLLGDGSSDTVELQWNAYKAKIHYNEIQWDQPTTFPIRVNDSYERRKL